MKLKSKGIKLILLIIFIISIFTGCNVGNDADAKDSSQGKTTVISENVSLDTRSEDSNLQVKEIDTIKITENVKTEDFKGSSDKEIFFNKNNALYGKNLETNKTRKIVDMKGFEVSEDGKRILLFKDKEVYVYDVMTNKMIPIEQDRGGYPSDDIRFMDHKGNYLAYTGDKDNEWKFGTFTIFDVNKKQYIYIDINDFIEKHNNNLIDAELQRNIENKLGQGSRKNRRYGTFQSILDKYNDSKSSFQAKSSVAIAKDEKTGETFDLVKGYSIKKIFNDKLYIDLSIGGKGGIYEVDFQGNMKEVLVTEDTNKNFISQIDFLDNNKLLYSGEYQGNSGIFVYDISNKNITKLIAGIKTEEGNSIPSYKLSPSKDKILIETLNKQYNNEYSTKIYAAEIIDGNLISPIKVLDNSKEESYSILEVVSHWTENSNKAMIYRTRQEKNGEETVNYLDKIRTFKFTKK
ncbi:hypothetical protein CLPU_4c02620 [Gottschalkia purinilytica]|uniref:Lipoprotein n=1 Tax=Gottschalkia purinilytica TaxID=1503 RepID=A0A0L0WCN0_GOTPU|nr:hypothetical protein [Gottschalkia purinilytica]KNF09216.1 hypothetical protein CLPU_4c02620 [Gottschalkia purinilytica]